MTNARSNFKDALAVGQSLDLPLPDSRPVEEAFLRARGASEPWLFNHVVHSWLYSVRLAQARSLAPDQELMAVAVLLHDLGLGQDFAADRRFEVAGAGLARDFAMQHGMGERRAETVWD